MKKRNIYLILVVFGVLCGGCKGLEKRTETNMELEDVVERTETAVAVEIEEALEISEEHKVNAFHIDPLIEYGLQLEQVSVTIPGLTKEYDILFFSDLHIIVENEEIAIADMETVHSRVLWFSGSEEMTSAKYWEGLPDVLNACCADAVLFGGDMIDYCSTANVECLKRGLEKLEMPYVYVRADHDLGPYYCEGLTAETCEAMHEGVDGNAEIFCLEFPEFCIVGQNNSTNQMSEAGLERVKEVFAIGKPIILLTHVPFDSVLDESLQTASKEVWQDLALVWGEDSNYKPNAITRQWMDMIYMSDSLVKEILCGHLHFTWDGYITENTHQHVFAPAVERIVGVIRVKGN